MTWLDTYRAAHWHTGLREPLELPERFRGAKPSEIRNDRVQSGVRRYCRDFDTLAVQGLAPAFFGRSASWKTYGACCIARWAYHRAGVEVDFVDCAATFSALELRRYDPHTAARLERLRTVPLLILDDFLLVRENTWSAEQLIALVSFRFADLLPTIYTGNLRVGDDEEGKRGWRLLHDRYAPSLARRILHGSKDLLIVTV